MQEDDHNKILTLLTWNVRGKLAHLHADLAVMDTLGKADVLCFSEIGSDMVEAAPPIPGFVCVAHVPRPRASHCGGVACYVKHSISMHTSPVYSNPNDGISMIAIRAPGFRTIYIASCYLPHMASEILGRGAAQNRRATEAWFDVLQEVLVSKAHDGDVVITGDLNTHTGELRELDRPAVADWDDMDIPGPMVTFQRMLHSMPARSNLDISPHRWRGTALIDWCAENRLVIMNGRLPGDDDGNLTYNGVGGSTTIDYFIAAPELCFNVDGRAKAGCHLLVKQEAFTWVIPGTTMLFDHAPVMLNIRPIAFVEALPVAINAGGRLAEGVRVRWNEALQHSYFLALSQNHNIQAELMSVLVTDDSVQAASLLKQVMTEAAVQAGMTKPITVHGPRAQALARNTRHHQLWFDDECSRLRGLKLHAERLHGAGHPLTVAAAKLYWGHITRVRREHIDAELNSKVQEWYQNPRLFWKEFKSSHGGRLPFSVQEWTIHFRNLLGNSHPAPLYGNSLQTHVAHYPTLFPVATDDMIQAAACLNLDITADEVKVALSKMKPHKASGVDGLPAEFLTQAFDDSVENAIHALLPHITRCFNLVMRGTYPDEWATCVLAPVPKPKANYLDKNGYRGIAVGMALSKLYSMVLLIRLDNVAESKGMRARGQAGFRKGRGTPDNAFVLQHAIESCQKRGKTMFVAFIDFEKAYDRVNRDLLWRVLESYGLHGDFLTALRHMYQKVTMQVRVNGDLGESFQADVGVKQGDPLSPLLFGLFIDRFEAFLDECCEAHGVQIMTGSWLRSLLYADDLILMAETREGLQAMLACLGEFAIANQMNVNLIKSETMVFNGRNIDGFTFNGTRIKMVEEFLYLGIIFRSFQSSSAKLHVKTNMARQCAKGTTALRMMQLRIQELRVYNVKVQINMFNALVSSIIGSGCEVWAPYHMTRLANDGWGSACEAEKVQRMFLRKAFGSMPESSTGDVILLESGCRPLLHAWVLRAVGWYNRIIARPVHDIVRIALRANLDIAFDNLQENPGVLPILPGNPVCWCGAFYNMICSINSSEAGFVRGLRHVDVGTITKSLTHKWLHKTADLTTSVQAYQLRDVPNTISTGMKTITYCKWFGDCQAAGSLYALNRLQHICIIASMRMSFHRLNIETGRHDRVMRANRLCRCCAAGAREDELHIFECAAYADLRAQFADIITQIPTNDVDSWMRKTMNPLDHGSWQKLANFFIMVMAVRERILIELT